jgi:Flp pilus assembly protein TadD
MTKTPFRLAFACIVFTCFAYGAQPWDASFHQNIHEILEASAKITPADHPEVVLLLEDCRYFVRTGGRIERKIHKVYRVDQQDAVEDWSSIEQEYQPWYQETPELKARVITKEGAVRWLDPKTIADAPARQFESSVFSDERVLRAPLPNVAQGAIVEIEILIRDKAPLLDAGTVTRISVPQNVPLESFHIQVRADPGVKIHTSSKLLPEPALAKGSSFQIDSTIGPLPVKKHMEWNLPADETETPYFAFSTGESWNAIASRYASIVDQKIQGADLKQFMEGINLQGPARDVAARLAAKLHHDVRYTGVEFGEAAIVPVPPLETIQRGYGDCKDKATLLVAMLRAAGLKADVALLNASSELDVDTDLPGMGMFNHAIVYVDANPPLWIDATAQDVRVGFLPSDDEGRRALIANRSSQALTMTPQSRSENMREVQHITVKMSEMGSGTIQDDLEVTGASLEPLLRTAYGKEVPKSKEQIEKWVKSNFAAKSLGTYEVMRRDDMSRAFHMNVEALDALTASTGLDDAGVALSPGLLFQRLPYALQSEPEKDAPARVHDFVISSPYQMELQYRILPPALFKPSKLPASEEIKLGSATLKKTFETKADGSIEAKYFFDSGRRRITPAEFTAFRNAVLEQAKRPVELIAFVPETGELLAIGQMSKAIEMLQESIKRDPKNFRLHMRLGNALINVGLGDAGREEARIARDLDPQSPLVWENLGMAEQYDAFGRLRQGDWNPGEAEKALRKAIELDKEDKIAPLNLAILFEFNSQGWRYGSGARMDEAVAQYRELSKKPQHSAMVEQNLAIALMRMSQWAASRDVLQKSGYSQGALPDVLTAVEESPARAIIKAQAAYPDPQQRASHMLSVAQSLVMLRRYNAASLLLSAAGRLINAPEIQTRAELMKKIKPWQEQLVKEDDPRWPVQQLMLCLVRGTLTMDQIHAIGSKRVRLPNPDEFRSFHFGFANERHKMVQAGLEEETVVDLMISLMDMDKDGDETHGYRIKVTAPGTSSLFSVFVIKEDGKYRFLDAAGPGGMDGIGQVVLDLLEAGDLKAAQWWLDQAVSYSEAREDGTGRPAVIGLWSGTTEAGRGPAAARIAAASLLGAGSGSPKALAMLEAARAKASNATERSQLDIAICETLTAGKKWPELVIAAQRLSATKLFHEEGFRFFIKGAKNAGKWKELEAEAAKALAANKDHVPAMRAMILAKLREGDNKSVSEWLKKLSAARFIGTDERIFGAWVEMSQGTASTESLTRMKEGKDVPTSNNSFTYVEALLEAVLRNADEALPHLKTAVQGEDINGLPAIAWAVHGKVCEQLHLATCAKESSAKARTIAESKKDDEASAWLLGLPKP